MMSFRTLWALDSSVDGETGQNPVANDVAAAWFADPGSVTFFRSSANFIYRLTIGGKPAYLRMAAGTERTATSIRQELELLEVLAARSVPVVRSLPAWNGDQVISVGTTIGPMSGVVFEALPGETRDLDDLDLAGIEHWGATVGRLHTAMKDVPAGLRRPAGWASALAWVTRKAASLPEPVAAEGARLREFLLSQPRTPDRYGLLHTDLELDNIVWDGDVGAVLDFDEYGEGWYLLDIAKALTDVLDAGEGIDSPRVQAFVTGYRQEHPLSDKDVALIPEFLAITKLRMYYVLNRAVNMEPEEAPVEWLRNLIVRLQGWMAGYEAGLAEDQVGTLGTEQ